MNGPADGGSVPRKEPGAERARADALREYLAAKIDQLLVMMGSRPLDASELTDRELLDLDPIGTVSDSFSQVLAHLHDVNDRLRKEVADRERAEGEHREKEEVYRTLAEFSSDWVFWRDGGRMLYISPACEQISGYSPEEFHGDPDLFYSIVHPEDREAWRSHCLTVEGGSGPSHAEFRIVTKQGQTRWISHVCRPVHSERGVLLGVRGSNSNVTDRILVMDDEEAVRAVASQILRALGYDAVAVRDGEEAIEAYRGAMEAGAPFDAAVLDLTIPGGMGGREAVRGLLALDPGARAIVSSGYSNDPVMSAFREHGFRGMIAKPYRVSDLGKVLREILAGRMDPVS